MTRPPGLSPAAHALLARRAQRGEPDGPRRGPAGAEAPVSFQQSPYWIFASLNPDDPTFNLPKRLRLRGRIDPAAMAAALTDIATRHEVLRTSFMFEANEPVPRVLPPQMVPVRIADLRSNPDLLETLLDEEADRPFRLEEGRLIRGVLAQTADHEWVLQVTFHHIAFDGWSTTVFFDELGPAYDARASGDRCHAGDLPIQYGDFATWQRRREHHPDFARAEGYWRSHLAGRHAGIPLPRPHRASPGSQRVGGRATAIIEADTVGRLREWSRSNGSTLASQVIAGFGLLTIRRCGETSAVLGNIMSGRTHRDLESLIGAFVSLCPVVFDTAPDLSFRAFSDKIRRDGILAQEHGGYALDRLGSLLRPGGSRSLGTAYDVVFNYRNFPFRLPTFQTVEVLDYQAAHRGAIAPVGLAVTEIGATLSCELSYDVARFDRGAADRWMTGLQATLRAASLTPDAKIHDLPIMGAEESAAVVRASTGPTKTFPGPSLTHRHFERWAREQPNARAVWWRGTALSYRQLDQWADRIAARLREEGVGPEQVIGILGNREPASIAAMIGIWKAGGAFLPLDPIQPADRLAQMARAAGIELALSQGAPGSLPEWGGRWIDVGAVDGTPAPRAEDAADDPTRLAYVLFTSGSTGMPKGIQIEHRTLRNFLGSAIERHKLGPASTSLLFASLGFDAALEEIFGPLSAGGTVALADRDEILHPETCSDILRAARVAFVVVTPTVLAGLDPGALPGLREVVVMGEAAEGALYRRWALGRNTWNGYGPTECTIMVSQGLIRVDTAVITIGHPTENSNVYVLDSACRMVPFDTPGEIHVGGAVLARGYLNDPDLTASRFVPDPHRPGSLMYRTGDRGRLIDGHGIEFLGRLDRQVKIRGQRVEPGEIEAVLGALPGVRLAAVSVQTDAGETRLIGYVEPKGGVTLDKDTLRRSLMTRLPSSMVPTALVILDRLPLTPGGKVDRQALPIHDFPASEPVTNRGSLNVFELELLRIWSELFPNRSIHPTDDFFELGGHSLLGARVVTEVERATGLRLPISAVFEDPTVSGLARRLAKLVANIEAPRIVAVQPKGHRRPFFMVHDDPRGWRLIAKAAVHVPVYAFPPASGPDGVLLTTVEEAAGANLAELLKIQPKGPYRLGGHCVGGLVAFEMAQRLRAAAEEVEFLLLADTRTGPWRLRPISRLVREAVGLTTAGRDARQAREALVLNRLNAMLAEPWRRRLVRIGGYPLRMIRRRFGLVDPIAERAGGEPGLYAGLMAALGRMGDLYCARPYPGEVTYVLAGGGRAPRRDADKHWEHLARRVELLAIDGTHDGMVTTHLPGIIAEHLERIDQVDRSTSIS